MGGELGRLVPVGGGDAIPLTTNVLTIGRRESCDICLKFNNVSSIHCELSFRNGLWTVRDMGSSNGTKVNGVRMLQLTLKPGDEIGVAGNKFQIEYELPIGITLDEESAQSENVFGQSLMERAGLSKPKRS
jgi:pSer/pThr/pTyr-binding forkhead associated (FHA) protein